MTAKSKIFFIIVVPFQISFQNNISDIEDNVKYAKKKPSFRMASFTDTVLEMYVDDDRLVLIVQQAKEKLENIPLSAMPQNLLMMFTVCFFQKAMSMF